MSTRPGKAVKSGLAVCCFLVALELPLPDRASAQVMDLDLPSEEHLNHDPAFTYSSLAPANAQHRRNSVASMIQLEDGSVMIAYDDYGAAKPGERAAHDFFASKIVSRLSRDGGKTWSEQRVLLEPKADDFTIQAPGLLKLASGDILLTCVRVYKGMETGKDWDPGVTSSTMALYRSTDGGKTFGEEPPIWKRVPVLRYQGGAPWNIQLKSGRILLSYQSAARQYGAKYTIGIAVSDDNGRTWRVLDNRVALSDGYGVEPCIAELADGSLMMSIRTGRGQIYLSRSTDGGETWSEPVPSGLNHPASITKLVRVPETNDLLMFFNNTPPGRRTPFTAALSRDGGRTWKIVGDIVHGENIEVGVADVIFPSKDKVLVAFSWTTPPWARQRIPTCAAMIDREWFYRPVPRRLYRRAHPRLYPADEKRAGQAVEPLVPDASALKEHLVLWLKADAIDPDDPTQVRTEGPNKALRDN